MSDDLKPLDELPEGDRHGKPGRPRKDSGGGTSTASLVSAVEDGSDLHDSMLRLADRGWTEAQLYELMDQSAARESDPVRWQKRRGEIPDLVKSAADKHAAKAAQVFGDVSPEPPEATPSSGPNAPIPAVGQPLSVLPLLKPADMASRKVKPREWIVEPLIPKGEPTLVYGKGAAGKSLALLQLAICIASGKQWLGRDVPKGRALFFTCEDNTDELTRRAADILKSLGIGWEDLGDRLLLIPMRDCEADATLAHPGGNGLLTTTRTYDALKAVVDDFKPNVVIVDTLADTFAGNENVRAEAKQFVKMIARLRLDASMIVTAHLSVSAEEDGRGFSGSTGWPAAVRASLTFGRPKDAKLKAFGDVRLLESKKANYAAEGAGAILMRYEDGAFVPVTGFTMETPEADVDALFLKLLAKLAKAGRYVTESRAASALANEAEAKEAGVSKDELQAAMLRLFDARRIANEQYTGANSNKKMRLGILDPNSPTPWKPT